MQSLKLEQTQTQSQEKEYISEHPLASWGLCPNSILKQLLLAIHHGDSNPSLSPHTAIIHTGGSMHIYAPGNSYMEKKKQNRNMQQNNRTFNYFKVKVIYVFISLLEEEKKGRGNLCTAEQVDSNDFAQDNVIQKETVPLL